MSFSASVHLLQDGLLQAQKFTSSSTPLLACRMTGVQGSSAKSWQPDCASMCHTWHSVCHVALTVMPNFVPRWHQHAMNLMLMLISLISQAD